MTNRFCAASPQNLGCGTNKSDIPYGGNDHCPKCGVPHSSTLGGFGGGAVGATGRKVCPKCGLMQHSGPHATNKKASYHDLKCCDCNQPLLAYDDGGTLDYCIRCGRIYDSRYANRHGNGSTTARLVRCPKCGGNTRTYAAT